MSGRTEQPTPRRLREARRRGEAPISRELTAAASFAAGLGAAAASSASAARALAHGMTVALAEAGGGGEPWPALVRALALLARTSLPIAGAAGLAALAAGMLQTRGLFSVEAVRFRLGRLHPGRGIARLLSSERLVAEALGAARAFAGLALGWRLLAGAWPSIAGAPQVEVRALWSLFPALAAKMALALGGLLLAFGSVDVALARRRHRKALMMTRHEVARERREDEGEPRLKLERRRLHRALAAAIPVRRATCVVVNPTHLAVGLHHEKGTDGAPLVIAKGMGEAAARLRAEARRAGVPVVHDVALARALFRLADVGDEIPEELYEAAAAVLVHVHGLCAEQRVSEQAAPPRAGAQRAGEALR